MGHIDPGFPLVLSASSIPTLARDRPFNSNCVAVIAKVGDLVVDVCLELVRFRDSSLAC